MTDYILVVDIGTSSMRGVLYGRNGELAQIIQTQYTPEYLPDDWVEQDPASWDESLLMVARGAADWCALREGRIEAVSVTAQRSSAIPVDRDGNALYNTIMWQDKRTLGICEEYKAAYGGQIYEHTGTRMNPLFTAPKLIWLRRERPELYDRAYKVIVIPDYVIHRMTGKFVTDYTYGSRTSMMNIHTLQWDGEILALFGLDQGHLCELVEQGSVVGQVTGEFAAKTGLTAGIPVISAGGDQQCAALGAGVIENGSVQVTTGTGSFIIASSDRPALDPQQRMICNVAAAKGRYILESSVFTTASIYNWFHKNFYQGCDTFRQMDEEAAAAPVGCHGVVLLPHFQGRGSPDWNAMAKGMFFNLTMAAGRGDFSRAILEGIAAEVAENIEILREHLGGIDSIRIAGGLTKSPLFNQIQADCYGQPVYLPANREATSLGAWMSAAVTLGYHPDYRTALDRARDGAAETVYRPVEEHQARYRQLMDRRRELYRCLKEGGIYQLYFQQE